MTLGCYQAHRQTHRQSWQFFLKLVIAVSTLLSPVAGFAIPNDEQVIPSAQADAEQDAIAAQKQKSAEEDSIYGTKANGDRGDHYQVVPYFETGKTPKLKRILKNGTRVYKVKPSPQHYSGGMRFGSLSPTNLVGNSGFSFSQVYGSSAFIVNFDAEWQFFQRAGKLGLKGGMGIFTAHGQGRFASPANSNLQAIEVMNLYGFPLNAGLQYHLQFWDHQILVPFAEAGLDYFPFLETRSDQKNLSNAKIAGAPAWHWAAGGQIQLDWLDKEGIWQMDREYGINHIYLTADVRQIIGLSSTFDFSSLAYEGGFLFEF